MTLRTRGNREQVRGYHHLGAVTWTPRTDLHTRSSLSKRRPVSQMRELERDSTSDNPACKRLAMIGQGRLGHALASAFGQAGYDVSGPLSRGADGQGADVVLLCVPDGEIARAAAQVRPGPDRLVGHCSGATGLGVLAPHEAFSLHPLMTVTAQGAVFAGAGAAIAGDTPRGLALAGELARALGMHPVEIAERGSSRLPRRRLDRLELPRHAGGSRGARRRRRRASSASCSCRSSAPPSRTGPASAPSAL